MSILQLIQARPTIKRNAARFGEIVTTLAKYGLVGWVHAGHPEFVRERFKDAHGNDLVGLPTAERWRMALTDLGTTFIKLGQMLSTRPDLVGPDLAKELEQLQANTPADAPAVVRRVVEDELGKSIEDLFDSFDDTPLASASIGQVHRATLPGGRDVIVKVQHEGIQSVVQSDLEILSILAEFAAEHDEEIRLYQPGRMVAEFQRSLSRELDYGRELDHLHQFRENFADDARVHFPDAFEEFSSRRVLTMERMVGLSVQDVNAIQAAGYSTQEIARTGADTWIQMILRDGFFHADPHPGNLMVLEDGRLGVLDFGMVGRLDDRLRRDFESLVLAVLREDADELSEVILDLATPPPNLDRDAFRSEMVDFCGDYLGIPIDRVDVEAAMHEASSLIRRHRLVLPSGLAQLLRTLSLLESTSRKLDRSFNVIQLLKPYARRVMRERLSPQAVAKNMAKRLRSWDRLVETAPDDLRDILARFRRGTFHVHLQHRRLDTVTNRLVMGILSAALFLGSTLLLAQRVPPVLWGVSFFGMLGASGALVLAGRLLLEIRRSGKDDGR